MYTLNSFEEKANSITQDKIKIIEFNGVKAPVKFQCLKCGKNQEVARGEVLLRKGKKYQCQFCHYTKENLTKETKHKIEKVLQGKDIELIEFTKVGEIAKFKCKKCDNIFTREPLRILKNQKCPICESRCIAIPLKTFKRELKEKYNEEYEIVDDSQYQNMHTKILIRHNCGFIWKITPQNILYRNLCPKCSKKVSRGERRISDWLDKNQILYIPQWPMIINGHTLFFDFYLPKFGLVIEFQGEQHYKSVEYFGGEEAFEKRKYYDTLKKEWCKTNNVHLLEISYIDIDNIDKILLSSTTISKESTLK